MPKHCNGQDSRCVCMCLGTEVTNTHSTRLLLALGLAMRLFLLMRIDAHQMRINAHKPHQ